MQTIKAVTNIVMSNVLYTKPASDRYLIWLIICWEVTFSAVLLQTEHKSAQCKLLPTTTEKLIQHSLLQSSHSWSGTVSVRLWPNIYKHDWESLKQEAKLLHMMLGRILSSYKFKANLWGISGPCWLTDPPNLSVFILLFKITCIEIYDETVHWPYSKYCSCCITCSYLFL